MTKRKPGAIRGRPPKIKIPADPSHITAVENQPAPGYDPAPEETPSETPVPETPSAWNNDGGGLFSNLIARIESGSSINETPEEKPGKKPAKSHHATREDFSTLISSVLVLSISLVKIPDPLKPLPAEIDGVSYYASRLMIRHLPQAGKMNADMLDLVGLLSIGAGYYARVSPALSTMKPDPAPSASPVIKQKSNGKPAPASPSEIAPDDISASDPAVTGFLNRVSNAYATNNANGSGR